MFQLRQTVVAIVFMVVLISKVHSQFGREPKRISVTVLESVENQCPSVEEREEGRNTISRNVRAILSKSDKCGDPNSGWRQIAFINMSDTTYNCPAGLTLTSRTNAKRLCEPVRRSGFCSSTLFSSEQSYSQVCGRMIGYQVGSTSAFGGYTGTSYGIDTSYVEGVSLTHGISGARQHIWTFASGIEETTRLYYSTQQCPCDTSNSAVVSPSFVGNDYFCESGLHTAFLPRSMYNVVFLNDPLWDGQDCTSTSTCCQFNDPPWFTKNLTNPTADDIEMRVCVNQVNQETTLLELIELYVK